VAGVARAARPLADVLTGVDSASGKNSSSSPRSKVDESGWSRACRMLGCRRLGFRVPRIEFSRVGVGRVDGSILV
jgi:hypothetical protein